MSRAAGSLKKFPFKRHAPYSLRFLLEIQPALHTKEAAEVVYGTGEKASIDEIYEYETWSPSSDTALMLTILCAFKSIPDRAQKMIFEELMSFAPCFTTFLARNVSVVVPRQFSAVAVIAGLAILFAAVSLCLEGVRILNRRIHSSSRKVYAT